MRYQEWAATVPAEIQGDSLWKVEAYRLSLFLADLTWSDATCLMRDRRRIGLSDQLYRSSGSVSANVAEGYSRGTGKDRAHFYEYALGSARECRDWYYKGRHILGEDVFAHRLALLTHIVRLLLTMVPQQRGYTLREEQPAYPPSIDRLTTDAIDTDHQMQHLLDNIPLPTNHAEG